jgi:hypothetical protein
MRIDGHDPTIMYAFMHIVNKGAILCSVTGVRNQWPREWGYESEQMRSFCHVTSHYRLFRIVEGAAETGFVADSAGSTPLKPFRHDLEPGPSTSVQAQESVSVISYPY